MFLQQLLAPYKIISCKSKLRGFIRGRSRRHSAGASVTMAVIMPSLTVEASLPSSWKPMAADSFFIHLLPEVVGGALLICRWVN